MQPNHVVEAAVGKLYWTYGEVSAPRDLTDQEGEACEDEDVRAGCNDGRDLVLSKNTLCEVGGVISGDSYQRHK